MAEQYKQVYEVVDSLYVILNESRAILGTIDDEFTDGVLRGILIGIEAKENPELGPNELFEKIGDGSPLDGDTAINFVKGLFIGSLSTEYVVKQRVIEDGVVA